MELPSVVRSPAARDRAPSPCCSADSSDSGGTCSHASTPASNALVLSLVVQVNALQDSNKQLYQELQETKAELETLKQSWHNHLPPEYEPGMLSGMSEEHPLCCFIVNFFLIMVFICEYVSLPLR